MTWEEMVESQGLVTCLPVLKFSGNVSKVVAHEMDPVFTNTPRESGFHQAVESVIPLDEPFQYTPNVSWTRIEENDIKIALRDVLTRNGESQPFIPKPKVIN